MEIKKITITGGSNIFIGKEISSLSIDQSNVSIEISESRICDYCKSKIEARKKCPNCGAN